MLSTYRQKQGEEGFTLIELLVVIIIIGILAAIAIPTFLGQRERARRGAVQSDLRNAAILAETYFTDNQRYGDGTGNFSDDPQWNERPSPGVVLSVVDADGSEFCIWAVHTDGLPDADGDGWYYESDATPQLYPQTNVPATADC